MLLRSISTIAGYSAVEAMRQSWCTTTTSCLFAAFVGTTNTRPQVGLANGIAKLLTVILLHTLWSPMLRVVSRGTVVEIVGFSRDERDGHDFTEQSDILIERASGRE